MILELFADPIAKAADRPGTEDFKTRLQELVARSYDSLPNYLVRGEGPDHEKHFYATVSVDGRVVGSGEGRSKKEAEQAAAGVAWDELAQEMRAAAAAAALADDTNTPAEAMP